MQKTITSILFITFFLYSNLLVAQKDSTVRKKSTINSGGDTIKKFRPRTAIIRSAMLPGWGQATNKKYWKMPIVYAALGTTTFIFFRNLKQYNEAKNAYSNSIDGDPSNDYLIPQPYFSVKDQPDRIKSFRNQVRQNLDYTVLFFIAFWGLNVVDAAVDAHFKTFDVSDDLSLQIKPGYSPLANTNGISIVLKIR